MFDARQAQVPSLGEYPRTPTLDAARIDVAGNRVTVTLRDHVDFSLLGIFMGGDHFDVEVHASAEAHEIP
jgi:hypothetical protein